ncbi:ParB/RepB/Spo0J family partition protein [Neoactinobaculum massilliense]|uniref:ParB/RepB/Spo0J family partition protein n=1 Tax=Neoactinobaculum massilliense TaxID=2364794 RepID=UPI000F527AD6|nr:ParB/RepB/Spo0J family partition protein [Neoactinobaculum massilliense]
MAQKKRRGLGSGLGALIPESQRESTDSPIDVFFGGARSKKPSKKRAGSVAERKTTTQRGVDLFGNDEGSFVDADKDPSRTGSGRSNMGERTVNSPSVDPGQSATTTPAKDDDEAIDRTQVEETNVSRETSEDGSGLSAETVESIDGEEAIESSVRAVSAPDRFKDEQLSGEKGSLGSRNVNVSRETLTEGDLVPVPGATFAEIPLDAIIPNRVQPRSVFDEDELDELAQSLREVGVLQPIVVRPLAEPDSAHPDARYELIMGERRWRAARRAELETIPAIVRHTEQTDMLRDALLENLHRAQLNPLEEAAAYQQLLEDFDCTQDELAKKIARSRPQIANTLRLLKLPPLVQRRVAAGVLTAGHARALLGLTDPAAMERLAQRIVAEGLSVRQTEEIVALDGEAIAHHTRRRRTKRYGAELGELSGRLGERLNTKVTVSMGMRKGSIKVDFANIEDLNRILDVLVPGESVITNSTEDPE